MLLPDHPPGFPYPNRYIRTLLIRQFSGISISRRDVKPFAQNPHFCDRAPHLLFQRFIGSRSDIAGTGRSYVSVYLMLLCFFAITYLVYSRISALAPECDLHSPQLPITDPSHSNVLSPANSMSPVTPVNRDGDSAKIVSPAGSKHKCQATTSHRHTTAYTHANRPHQYHHVRACKLPSLISASTMKIQVSSDAKHTSPKRPYLPSFRGLRPELLLV